MTCAVCEYARVHGEWPPDHKGTHCEGCHRSWASTAQSHCSECHRHFGSDKAGDAHRIYLRGAKEPACRDPKGFDRWETPDGPVWGGRNPEVGRAAAERAREARRGVRVKSETPETVGAGGDDSWRG